MSGSEVKNRLRQIVGANPNLPIQAKVVSVENDSCTVKLASGLELDSVRLKASINGDTNYILICPKVGSNVILLSITGSLDDLTVIKCDVAESIHLGIAKDLFIKILPEGISIEAINKPIRINSGNSSVAITDNGVDVISDKQISLNGGFEALYNKVPGMPITDVSQIGVSQKVKIG